MILLLLSCAVCPTGQGPIPVEVDWTTRFYSLPGQRLGVVESRSGPGASWVCSAWCDDPWADVWLAELATPGVHHPLPWAMPIVDPVTGLDFRARIGVSADVTATGETECHVETGDDTWTITVAVP